MSEEDCERAFEKVRFAKNDGEPHCVHCKCMVAYRIDRAVKDTKTGEVIRHRKLFKCAECLKQFSVTSGTAWHGRKLPFKKIMMATLLWTNGAFGHAGRRLRRDLKVNHKTGWHIIQRLRYSLTTYTESELIEGEFETDTTVHGGKIRKANRAEDRKRQPRRDESKVIKISALRERRPGGRIVPILGDESAVVKVILQHADPDAHPFVDEHFSWSDLFGMFPKVSQVKHAENYVSPDGVSTNLIESLWARYKNMIRGTYRWVSPQYAHFYNGECAWRERHCRQSNGTQFVNALAISLHHPPTPMRGYYQRTNRKAAS
ncbi:IS1595 family transposase [Parerythrobacter aestuarii]|uniref:IS1595 family transposase n=1 Tax=Parerythrobacter aestuarii TaxID=3020909 RepID=UPI0024DE8B65|nr:IS1595 family transposase [Parerythrobacter aestuarii]